MANPFGGFGGQSTFGSGSSPSAPVFGQSLFGQSTTTSTSAFTSNTFNQSVSQSSPQPGLFSRQTASSIPSSSLFGKSSVFGQTVSQSAGFQQSDNSSQGASQSAFGQTSLFGKPVSTGNVFGSPTFGAATSTNAVTTASLFTSTAENKSSTSTASLFGGLKPKTGSFSPSTGSQSAFGGGGFGSTSGSSLGTAPMSSSSLFTRPSSSSAFTSSNLFQGVKQETGGDNKSGLFGANVKTETKTLFGKTYKKEEKFTDKTETKPISTYPFGGVGVKQEDRGAVKTELFGKKQRDADRQKQSTGLFGKGTQSTQGLFGKSVPKDEVEETTTQDDPRPAIRRQVSAEINTKLAILCRNIPHRYNNTMSLKAHFKTYGVVTKVFPNQAKMQATIHFKTHNDAAEAKRRGRTLAPGIPPMNIFWSSYSGPSTPKTTKPSTATEQKTGRSVLSNFTKPRAQPKPSSTDPEDPLDEELSSMAGTGELRTQTRAVSPTPSTSATLLDNKTVIRTNMFEGVVARTGSEKLTMLELRDRYIRQNRIKEKKDIETAKAFIGTCLDMCPEKERYDRETKRRLSYYEIVPGTENIPGKNPQVDHRCAVKEYMRSSPDQDEPLPHELRPVSVLVQTMTYLLTKIADRGEDGRWGDWFDFLWNRTRGIRKDITQQQLNDRCAIGLIEKCARFHIYCSERLVEEDMHSFDAKINNENLTKCLQTLKEFYADLDKKQKCFCETEAEFRCYMVLMNLNEGDTLREVQHLRPVVRTSQAMEFALQAYFALNGNNYIKFFRLVKEASFMNACIMHRYFTQVRNKALTTMMRGYSIGSRSAQIPLKELVRLLGFESENEASEFCQHYGLRVTDGEAILDRSEYMEPETAWAPLRSVKLIESQQMVSVGELINGEAFGDVKYPVPRSSFDSQDRFCSGISSSEKDVRPARNSAQQSSIQERLVPSSIPERAHVPVEQIQEPASVVTQPEEPKQKPKVSIEKPKGDCVIKDEARCLFWEVIDDMCLEIGQNVKLEVDEKLALSEFFTNEILIYEVNNGIRLAASELIEEAEAFRDQQLKEELAARRERVAGEIVDEIIYDLVYQEVQDITAVKMREVKAQLKRECIERSTADLNAELVDEVMNKMVADVSGEVFETDVTQRIKHLDNTEKIVKLSRVRKYWTIWSQEYKAVTKLKRSMEDFPCAANMNSTSDILKKLFNAEDDRIVDKKFFISPTARLTIESPIEIMARRKATDKLIIENRLKREMLEKKAWAPIDLGDVVGKLLVDRHQSSLHQSPKKFNTISWKLLLCLPDSSEDTSISMITQSATRSLCDWLKVKFSKGTESTTPYNTQTSINTEVLSVYKGQMKDEARGYKYPPANLNMCVRTLEGTLDENDIAAVERDMLLMGTSALLFVLPAGTLDQVYEADCPEYKQYWSAQFSRLQSILSVNPQCQSFPLVVIIPTSANEEDCNKQAEKDLKHFLLQQEGYLCDIHVLTFNTDTRRPDGIDVVQPGVSEQLSEGIQWLAKNSREFPNIEVGNFSYIINNVLSKLYFSPTDQNVRYRKNLDALQREPNSLIELYNAVITHICNVLTSDTIRQLSWPALEFVNPYSAVFPPCHWNRGDHLQYVAKVTNYLKLPEFPPLDCEADWQEVKDTVWDFVTSCVDGETIPKLELCSKLRTLLETLETDFEEACNFQYGEPNCQPTGYNIPWTYVIYMIIEYKLYEERGDPNANIQDEWQPLKVAYIQKEMENFVVPMSWKYVESDNKIKETPSLDDTMKLAVQKARRTEEISVREISIVNDPNNMSQVVQDTWKAADNLKEALAAERRQSDHFTIYLEQTLKDGELSDINSIKSFGDFGSVSDRRKSLPSTIRKSDFDDSDVYELPPGKKRKSMSCSSNGYDMDPGSEYVHKPSLSEKMEELKKSVRLEKHLNDLHSRRLQLLAKSGSPTSTEYF